MAKEKSNGYSDFTNVEAGKNYLVPEEMPEGAYGSAFGVEKPVENKSSKWQDGQRPYSSYNYGFKALHEGMPRQMDDAHPPHDDEQK
ncbi:cytosolic protein [Caldibacillus lycopersici]|uniref:Cytosolic protein n=1 Tax=Perspicuibacillus lycopersici TaxID=1325689 RepID=A0AAE3IVH6_9BACI|nr:cytosolic protein [Perspicuibacillus lycopersici]MCU9612825.1 cytosolic protein [Perspicuibacillus lycopersici]